MLNVFEFLDYRKFLQSYYQERKNLDANFSYAVLAELLGLSSRGLLKLIMDGKRNLSHNSIVKTTEGLGLNKSQGLYFADLVQFNQSKNFEEKNRIYQKIMKYPQKQKVSILKLEQYNLYARWYFAVVHELLLIKDRPETLPEFETWAAQKLKPKVSPKEIGEACKQLQTLGMMKIENNRLYPSNSYHQTENKDDLNFAIQNFHREMMVNANEALNEPPTQREFAGVTLAFRKEDLAKAKEFIREFRQKFNFDFSANEAADSVYQLNIQFFELADGITKITDSTKGLASASPKDLNSANDSSKNLNTTEPDKQP